MRLSIIIPVYNVEDYVERCIRSLAEQNVSTNDFEIIVTNDGSPDNSREIIKNLQKEYANILLIDQENQGVSMARNNAINIAKGKYILAIDPDDYVLPNTLNGLLNRAENDDLDALYSNLTVLDVKGNVVWQCGFNKLKDQSYPCHEAYFLSRTMHKTDPDRSVGILFKRDILVKYNIYYPKDVPFLEDGVFLIKYFSIAEKCGFSDILFYMRTTRPGSATKSKLVFTNKSLRGFLLGIEDLNLFMTKFSFQSESRKVLNQGLVKFILLPLSICVVDSNFREYRKFRKELRAKGYKKLDLRGCRGIYKHLGTIYNISITLFYPYYLIFSKYSGLKKAIKTISNRLVQI